MVANLPYNVGTPIVLTMLRSVPRITRLVVMLQREAVDRLVAEPGSRVFGLPSVIVRLNGTVRTALRVPAHVFFPEPKVESSVAVIDRSDADPSAEAAIKLAGVGFGQRRKMLRSSLRGVATAEALVAAGIDPTLRAENLAPDDWLRLAEGRFFPGGEYPEGGGASAMNSKTSQRRRRLAEVVSPRRGEYPEGGGGVSHEFEDVSPPKGEGASVMNPKTSQHSSTSGGALIVEGFAKVNLSLRVRPRDTSGYHPIRSLVQSIGWADRVTLGFAHDEDGFTVDGDLPAEEDNLAWRAVNAVRIDAGSRRPVLLHLEKRIAVAAGLGGGSADAAAGLVAASRLFQSAPEAATRLAPELGSDVAFCLVGGTAWMEGRGEVVTGVPIETDYAVAVMVPPFELSTAEVYRRWDEMDGPAGVGWRVVRSRRPYGSTPRSPTTSSRLLSTSIPISVSGRRTSGVPGDALLFCREAVQQCSGSSATKKRQSAAIAVVEGARGLWAGVPVSFGARLVEP